MTSPDMTIDTRFSATIASIRRLGKTRSGSGATPTATSIFPSPTAPGASSRASPKPKAPPAGARPLALSRRAALCAPRAAFQAVGHHVARPLFRAGCLYRSPLGAFGVLSLRAVARDRDGVRGDGAPGAARAPARIGHLD